MSRIESLRTAIRNRHGCESEHSQSIAVVEQFDGLGIWDGIVELFVLRGHPRAQRCYAWIRKEKDGSESPVMVLEITPVDSVIKAICAALAAEMHPGRKKPDAN